MVKSLSIGQKEFTTNLIQGPLAGVSCAPFRRLIWQYSQPAFTYTEMISCKTLIYQSKKSHERFVTKSPQEGPVCFQLSSSEPLELALATKIAVDYGADLIDLNCGCPVKKIRQKGAGSSLLAKPVLLYQLISAMKENASVPVGIKIRVDDEFEQNDPLIAKVIIEAGADFVVVHGRHWTQHYETPCRHDRIQFYVEALSTIPVIGNGDIDSLASLKNMLATNCAGAMIARAGVGQPWLIAQLTKEMNGEEFTPPPVKGIGELFLQHITDLATLLHSEKFAIIQARKLAKYYARRIENKNDFCMKINQTEDLIDLKKIIAHYYDY